MPWEVEEVHGRWNGRFAERGVVISTSILTILRMQNLYSD